MKVSASVKTRCPNCQIIRRREKAKGKIGKKTAKPRLYIYCSVSRNHNQRQG